MIIVVDNFFDDRIFNAVYDEISRLEFNDVKVGADNDGTWTAEEGVEYPGLRTQVFYKVRPLLDDAIIRQLDNTPTPFTSKAYNYYQYAHLRLEKDNDDGKWDNKIYYPPPQRAFKSALMEDELGATSTKEKISKYKSN